LRLEKGSRDFLRRTLLARQFTKSTVLSAQISTMDTSADLPSAYFPRRGQGQAIDFIATDLLKITNRRITDNWHIEDNLTLLARMGVDKVEQ
jgi:hypothetical protein